MQSTRKKSRCPQLLLPHCFTCRGAWFILGIKPRYRLLSVRHGGTKELSKGVREEGLAIAMDSASPRP